MVLTWSASKWHDLPNMESRGLGGFSADFVHFRWSSCAASCSRDLCVVLVAIGVDVWPLE